MGRPDTASGEHMVEAGADLVHGGNDRLRNVWDDAHLPDRNADFTKLRGNKLDVGVLGSPRQNLVANHQDASHRIASHERLLKPAAGVVVATSRGRALPRAPFDEHRSFRIDCNSPSVGEGLNPVADTEAERWESAL